MKIAVASDHRGIKAVEQIKATVAELDHEYIDLGCCNDHPVDYPDVAYLAAEAVSSGKVDRAVLVCGTGIGMSIAANKVKGVRAALCFDELNAKISRQHNDANVLCMSGDLLGNTMLRKMVETWLTTEFLGGRHKRRVSKIAAIEEGKDPRTVTD
ncbi:Putative sugar phosphate isomerase YwlF [Anaerohalosphaera lusitana]|uniref:Putative sugar phosphate isomerase YwlF n=1 Tax=Anaerohalosphaera lusitana TaxID=1936003 RepID=A0A1U9NMR4_9BACT|nr:ribose 5-phosphate isomerase B [Anaerohalosphaera lusitana]AQT69018.1 Putative sugar phosphate isomerase YwlF [Anaerohalosphaera lusitana]